MAIRVLIADNNDIIRSAIASTLKADPALEVVGEAANFAETLERAGALNPDIVLLVCICRTKAVICQKL